METLADSPGTLRKYQNTLHRNPGSLLFHEVYKAICVYLFTEFMSLNVCDDRSLGHTVSLDF